MSSRPIIFYGFVKNDGSINHVSRNLICSLAELGKRVVVVTHLADQGPLQIDLETPVELINLNNGSDLKNIIELNKSLKAYGRFIFFVNSNIERNNRHAVVIKLLNKATCKLVFRIGTAVSQLVKIKNRYAGIALYTSMRLTYRMADLVICNSNSLLTEIADYLKVEKARLTYTPNPTIAANFADRANLPVQHEWFTDPDLPIVIAVGRLRKAKSFNTLIEAFAIVNQHIRSRLVIIGEGNERQRLNQLVAHYKLEDSVALLGHMDNPFPYVKKAKVFVLSSRFEGSPNALIEALALHVPVVSTDCRHGPAEILQQGRFGSLVPVGDAQQMAAAIQNVLSANFESTDFQAAITPFQAISACVNLAAALEGLH